MIKIFASYIAKAQSGMPVVLMDEKKGRQVALLSAKKSFSSSSFCKALDTASGVLSLENHPEWESEQSLSAWLIRERLSDDRTIERY